jgi:hypothetical protein
VTHSVGWCWIYPPRSGADAGTANGTANGNGNGNHDSSGYRLVKIPRDCDLDCVLSYEVMASAGQVFTSGAASCVDAIAAFLYKCSNDSDAARTVDDIYRWFDRECQWETVTATATTPATASPAITDSKSQN